MDEFQEIISAEYTPCEISQAKARAVEEYVKENSPTEIDRNTWRARARELMS